ncbi:DUF1972 domain-containing protein [Nitrincola nitratireducens]|uniref:Uncharacterized protein n=1 Tax=Nitrincola nitratireducens TaxID=1229521 RepID=W9UWP5_9GAMM|nr:DUF1972 domain-containing protein [Nitrincola nitratireducens]EXJ09151.1 hypothetical protein D791_03938 [Nitrincola nitratireducens]
MTFSLFILGTRGIPAQHGGFETFADELALYLSKRDWNVNVYCQIDNANSSPLEQYHDINLINIKTKNDSALNTMVFDLKASIDAMNKSGILLTLGYNTAIFNIFNRIKGQTNIINMDGIEWHRAKWSKKAKAWFWLNEKLGSLIGNHLVADHPLIKRHLERNVKGDKITMIPYGSHAILYAPDACLANYDIEANGYSMIIARPEPENSILEIVKAFSSKKRNHRLMVLGNFSDSHSYHNAVKAAASDEVFFPGAIYDKDTLSALRFHSRLYIHGHTVGGTNPSLVEALGAGSAILAHDNGFNRWVADDAAIYFSDVSSCSNCFDQLLNDNSIVSSLKQNSRNRHTQHFTWEKILGEYEQLLLKHYPKEK